MTDEEYIEIFNRVSTDLVKLFPDGKRPDSDAARFECIRILREKREACERLAMEHRIVAQVTYALEADICKVMSDEQLAEIRKRDKSGEVRKITSVKEKKNTALEALIKAGFSEDQARLMMNEANAGKMKV